MDQELRKLLDEHGDNVAMQHHLAGITAATVENYILAEMAIAIGEQDWEAEYTLLGMTRGITDRVIKAEVLNRLLLMPGHTLHQEVAMEIQRLASPLSVPSIRSVLEGGFGFLAYTSSDDDVIAKWFSHALAEIGTPEAVELIKTFAGSDNPGIASEMSYRLARMKEY